MQVDYKFYATLFDSFQYYLDSENDDAFQEFIDKLNRKKIISTPAMKGTAFNEIVDSILAGKFSIKDMVQDKKGNVLYQYKEDDIKKTFAFNPGIINIFVQRLRGSVPQKYVEGVLSTRSGNVMLYGYADEIQMNKVIDIKTTGKYVFPKYLKSWQRKIYPYCLKKNGIYVDTFEFLITNFNNVYVEEYPCNYDSDIIELQRVCEHLIDFIENHKNLITSTDPKVKKLFALDEKTYQDIS
jgi:hypothetical protein